MNAPTDRLEFAPPPTRGLARSLGLAILAHAVLLAALTWGLHWKREAVNVSAEAELWSAVPQQAAPKLVEAPTAPPEAPEPPVVSPPPPPDPPQADTKPLDVDIAVAREKLRLKKELELKHQQELEKQRVERQRVEKQRLEKLKNDKLLLEQKRLQDKRDQERAAAEEKKKKELETQRKQALKAQEDAKQMEAQRQTNLRRMAGLAGAAGAPGATGTTQKSTGPSASYAGRIRASIKPNIVFTEDLDGNPAAEVEVRTAPDGTIVNRKLVKPSGVKSWDDAVLRAIDKTGKLPRDVDGHVPSSLVITFRPKD